MSGRKVLFGVVSSGGNWVLSVKFQVFSGRGDRAGFQPLWVSRDGTWGCARGTRLPQAGMFPLRWQDSDLTDRSFSA